MPNVGILIIDDDIVSQSALKNVLDSEGWRIRVVPPGSDGLMEIASGQWNLVIVNVDLSGLRGPLFSTLKDLAQGEADVSMGSEVDTARAHRLRVLFLVPMMSAKEAQPVLEREGLSYSLKPYHLHDFLEKVSELLLEGGAIAEPIRSMGDLSASKKHARQPVREVRSDRMFASREDYQMSEEEMAEFERQEETERKKREKKRRELGHF